MRSGPRWVAAGAAATFVFAATALVADTPAAQAQFRSAVDLVTLDVCVRDRTGRFVTDLTADNFTVLENGVAQRVAVFESSDALPLNVILLIDRSASMYGHKLDRARQAAITFAQSLRPGDDLEIIAFNQRAMVVRAADTAMWAASLSALTASGATALYDAMVLAANQLTRRRPPARGAERRDVIIILSDGEDTASLVGFDEVLPLLRRSGALVYGLSLRVSRDGQTLGATWPLQQLARDTGARALGVPQVESLAELYAQINQELRNMYRIGYVSSAPSVAGGWRQIAVRVNTPQAQVRTRSGYYAR